MSHRNQPSLPIKIYEWKSLKSFTPVRCWLLIGQCTLFTLKIIGELPSSWPAVLWLDVDMITSIYITQVQVRRFSKYCTLVIKSLSEIMLRNGFKNLDYHRITKPKQSLISVLISKWFILINRKTIQNLPSIKPKPHVNSPFNKWQRCGNLLCIMTMDIATGDSLSKISFYKKSCDQILTLTWNYVVIMLNANQSQTQILITWPNMYVSPWDKDGKPSTLSGNSLYHAI